MKVIMRDGWFMNEDGARIYHSFLTASGEQKGLRTILKKRTLWKDGMKKPDACALLKTQLDFIEQKEWLTETVMVEPGFDVGFFPKVYCEFNFIEMFWGAVKRFRARLEPKRFQNAVTAKRRYDMQVKRHFAETAFCHFLGSKHIKTAFYSERAFFIEICHEMTYFNLSMNWCLKIILSNFETVYPLR